MFCTEINFREAYIFLDTLYMPVERKNGLWEFHKLTMLIIKQTNASNNHKI